MNKTRFWLAVGSVAVTLCCWLLVIVLLSRSSVQSFQAHDWLAANRSAHQARVLLSPFRLVLGPVSPDIRLWSDSLRLISSLTETQQLLSEYLPATFSGDQAAKLQAEQLRALLPELEKNTTSWLDNYQQSRILHAYIDQKISTFPEAKKVLDEPSKLKQLLNQGTTVADRLLQGSHRYFLLLQNTDELRATGGFIGSYARVQLEDGVVTMLDVQDIYTPDGQYTGFTEAPAGVKEYLSGGKGYRLPDANWNPDFPLAAQELLLFFTLGKESDVDGLIAINLSLAEQLLQYTGPIFLPDYGQTVTAENLSTLARADRDQFFAGSRQKRSFLYALFTQFKLRFSSLQPGDVPALINIFSHAGVRKDIQAFSTQSDLQNFFSYAGVTGQLNDQNHERYLFLVESNVGINKSNRLVSRQVEIDIKDESTVITVNFTNQNPETTLKSERGEYINYQRLLIPTSHHVKSVFLGDTEITQLDDTIVKTSTGTQLRQLGFLVPVPAQSTAQLKIELSHPALPIDFLAIQKQSGLPPTLYNIATPTKTQQFIIDQDIVIPFATMQKEK